MSANSSMLDGFEIVASDSIPSLTLDRQRRFYLNTSARRLIGLDPYDRISIAYNPIQKALAIIRPDASSLSVDASDLSTSAYSVDKRFYMSARHFANNYNFPPEGAPYRFVYERGASDGSVFIFRLQE